MFVHLLLRYLIGMDVHHKDYPFKLTVQELLQNYL